MTDVEMFGPWALVTGASSGIGKAFARELAAKGFHVVLVARHKDELTRLAEELSRKHSVRCQVMDIDLTADKFAEKIRTETEGLDIGLLVSNAGAGALGALIRKDVEVLKSMLKLNVFAQMELTHLFASKFVQERKKAGILLVSSAAGLQGVPYSGNYSGAKAYIINFGEALHYELKERNIHVSVLIPGPTNTPGLTARSDIDLSQMPGKPMEAEAVVRGGLKALKKNKATYIPGLPNRLIARMPRKTMINLLGGLMKKHAPCELRV